MPDFEPRDPLPYDLWVPILGFVLVGLALAWLVYMLWKPGDRRQRRRDQNAPQVRATYGQRLDGLLASFQQGQLDLRQYHLEVGKLIRDFGSARQGRDLTTMSRSEIAGLLPGSKLGELLGRIEQPSFDRDPNAMAQQTHAMAREVIVEW